ncbi:MAG: TonB-dependent receptor plug [Gemmatimonadetes bacterium]|nr:TonB-dependent receptor plug [Gemmatimonadota bacterium]
MALLITSLAPLPGFAQPVAKASGLTGIVHDSLGRPIAYATVYVDGGVATTANDSGRFHLADVPMGSTLFGVRRMGYGPLIFKIDMPGDTTVHVAIRMHQVVARMREVTVEEKRLSTSLYRSGFYHRQKAGTGFFLEPLDITDRAPRRIEELFYGVPGVTVLTANGSLVPFGMSTRGYCPLSVFLDGRRYHRWGDGSLMIEVHDVKAAEIYPRPTEAPAEFHDPDNPLCGVIVLWTKID